jgi:hypothetical protein
LRSGLRGTRYFIEFPIIGANIDAFKLILKVEDMIKLGHHKYGGRVLSTDSFMKDDNVSYLIDYQDDSSTAPGGKSKGSIYIRGIKSSNGIDSYKFVMEKSVDFCDLDS